MKPDIVFFGEGLPDEFHDKMAEDKDECDLLIVVGSSLKVRPVALIPSEWRWIFLCAVLCQPPQIHLPLTLILSSPCNKGIYSIYYIHIHHSFCSLGFHCLIGKHLIIWQFAD